MFTVFHPDVCLASVSEMTMLFTEEEALLDGVTSLTRRNDFAMGRAAARQALRNAGFNSRWPVLKGEAGEPLWPEGYAGSISHSNGIAVAAVMRRRSIKAIGIDLQYLIEPERLTRLLPKIGVGDEAAWVNDQPSTISLRGTAVFAIKEAAYKLLSPFVADGPALSFKDLEICFDGDAFLGGRLLRDIYLAEMNSFGNSRLPKGTELPLSVQVAGNLLLAAIWLPC